MKKIGYVDSVLAGHATSSQYFCMLIIYMQLVLLDAVYNYRLDYTCYMNMYMDSVTFGGSTFWLLK